MRETIFRAVRSDFRVETFRGSGPGGQHRNKTESCVRITHIPTGFVATACEDRDQRKNRKVAFRRLAAKLIEDVRRSMDTRPPVNNETIRTYHAVDNRVKDHASGLTLPYTEVVERGNLGPMIEARAKETRGGSD